jgi:hypothetical protein
MPICSCVVDGCCLPSPPSPTRMQYSITSPLVTVVALGYFIVSWITWRYCLLYICKWDDICQGHTL